MMFSSIDPLHRTCCKTGKCTQYIVTELVALITRPRDHTLAAAAPDHVMPHVLKYTRKRLWPALLVGHPAAFSTIQHFGLRNMMRQIHSRFHLLSGYLDVQITQK